MSDRKKLPVRKFPISSVEVVCGEGYWARSESPHPLVTLDYDADGNLLTVSVIGVDLRVDAETNDPAVLSMLKNNPDLDYNAYVEAYESSRE